ncbi:TetR/AcrR family transcriptional regulator [Amycolatopsis sp. CA-230715]|uniref:TetR/AcrR family transcriptional regulator n=1 Tax=Amycolatopsis sp. CA-230715 TaxID=2745196 RepID=UPI001C026ECA|nr:TetR/AcrR family transcriptional regulator [Amycolatopsis sp. CA-230715]QWF76731.1 HTH-type transcriptional regulator BetI [Amycolatopsis sp. CA-230715]
MRSKKGTSGRDTFLGTARREQFIACAIDALAETGFAGASIAEVANRAGVSKSVVLYHFESRSALLEAVVTEVYTNAGPALVAALDAAPDERARLAAYLRGCTEFAWTHQKELRAVTEIFRNLRRDDGSRWYTAKDSEELIGFVQGLLEAGQRSGEFAEFDTRTLAVVLRATIDALPGLFESDPGIDGPQFAEHLVHLFDRTVRKDDR